MGGCVKEGEVKIDRGGFKFMLARCRSSYSAMNPSKSLRKASHISEFRKGRDGTLASQINTIKHQKLLQP
jgi:hypothetical protein